MDLQDVFISNLKRFRKEQHITQEKLAELCDKETSYIGQIKKKKRFPSLTFIENMTDNLKYENIIFFGKLYSETLDIIKNDVELNKYNY